MLPWQQLGSATIPGEGVTLVLLQRGTEFVIRIGTVTLMGSTMHGSEDVLAERACARIARGAAAHVLVGGLGMGFTLAAALRHLGSTARVTVAELVPAVVEWNRGPLAHLAGRPLEDPRTAVWQGDVAAAYRVKRAAFDAILLDIDNGPNGLTRAKNNWLYSPAGLGAAFDALCAGGILGVWSIGPDREFTRRLARAGFTVEEDTVRARRTKGGHHTLWFATRPRAGANRRRRT